MLFRDSFAAIAKLSDLKIVLPSLHRNSENFLLNGQILYYAIFLLNGHILYAIFLLNGQILY